MIAGPFLTTIIFLLALLLFFFTTKNWSLALFVWLSASVVLNHYMINLDFLPVNLWAWRIFFLSLVAGFFFSWIVKGNPPAKPGIHETLMLLFIIWSFTSACFSGEIAEAHGKNSIAPLINGFFVPFCMFYFGRHCRTEYPFSRFLFVLFILLLIYLSLTGFAEYYELESLVFPPYIMNKQIGIHLDRARGPLLNAAENGTLLAMLLILVSHEAQYQLKFWSRNALYAFLFPTVLLTLFFTDTRAVWVAAVAGMLAMLLHTRLRIVLLAVVATVVVTFCWDVAGERYFYERFTRRLSTLDYRIELYQESLLALNDKPLIGWGWGAFTTQEDRFTGPAKMRTLSEDVQHNTLLAIATETGLIGAIIYLSVIGSIVYSVLKKRRQVRHDHRFKNLCWTVLGLGIVSFVNGMFSDVRFYTVTNSLFFLFAGMVLGTVPLSSYSASTDGILRTFTKSAEKPSAA